LNKGKSLFVAGGSVLAVLLCIWLGFNAWTITPAGAGKVGVLFGNIDPVPLSSGFSVVNPLKKFIKFDLKDQSHTWDDVGVPAQDKLTSRMDVTVVFDTSLAAIPELYRTIGTLEEVRTKHFTKKVMSVMREVGKSVMKSEDFFKDETQQMMQTFMEDSLQEYFTPLGVNIKTVMFSDVQLPTVVTQAVIATKKRTEQLNMEKAQLAIEEQKAQRAVKTAEAANDSATHKAQAKVKMADAKAYALLKVKTAEAAGNRKLANSLTSTLVAYTQAKNWDGKLPTTSLGSTTPMLKIN
jgi:regulator of protease activity HflC (stomatin/prohibitin superfamily)